MTLDLNSIETHIGFVCTIVIAVSAVWQIRPRSTETMSHNADATYTPHRAFTSSAVRATFLALLALGIGAFTFYSIPTSGLPGPQGIPGSQGIRGPARPPGAAAPVGPKAAKRAIVIDAMARLSYLSVEYQKFVEVRKRYASKKETILHNMVNGVTLVGPSMAVASVMSADDDNTLVDMAAKDLGMTLKLDNHPNFLLNPLAPSPGDEKITDESHKGIYRRMYDDYNTAKITLNVVEGRYQSDIAILREKIDNYGENVPN